MNARYTRPPLEDCPAGMPAGFQEIQLVEAGPQPFTTYLEYSVETSICMLVHA